MNVTIYKYKETEVELNDSHTIFVGVSKQEAITLIRSLSEQLERNNSNVNREESYTDAGSYFTIAVEPEVTGEQNEQ